MTREELDQVAREMSWEDQNWLFNRLMERLWPFLAGKKVVFHEASGFWDDEELGFTEEDYEYYEQLAEEAGRKEELEAGGRGDSKEHALP
jgi:hypothetical protein